MTDRVARRGGLKAAVLTLLSLGSVMIPPATTAWADGQWLTAPVAPWNVPGARVPAGPPLEVTPQSPSTANIQPMVLCLQSLRPLETTADQLVSGAGWQPFGGYETGWGVTIVRGVTDYDTECRPLYYQHFVFVGDTFAGTISPQYMGNGRDGMLATLGIVDADRVVGVFERYGPDDARCCPANQIVMAYTIDRSGPMPVVVPDAQPTELGTPPAAVTPGASWLDAPQTGWNQLGAAVPPAPAAAASPAAGPCAAVLRPPETDADNQVAAAGWALYGGYETGWGLSVVHGLTDFDASCRPVNYQAFVFRDGVFAGTVSPEVMTQLQDGALLETTVAEEGGLTAVFQRFRPDHQGCCPDGYTALTLQVPPSQVTPLLVPVGTPQLLAVPPV